MEFEADMRSSNFIMSLAGNMLGNEDRMKNYGFDSEQHCVIAGLASYIVSFLLHYMGSNLQNAPQSTQYPSDSMRAQATKLGIEAALGRLKNDFTNNSFDTKASIEKIQVSINSSLKNFGNIHPHINNWVSKTFKTDSDGENYFENLLEENRDHIKDMRKLSKFNQMKKY
ncbi:hypothetical protein [Cyclobacterium marinum]|uniref:hypothetical protein n=1 Tax=Cyclobacterium marinum TaxID=104 RepID=UPI0011EFFE23|nr:hypothetical protein [Cyclobacterium marinum]MBI0398016.1 hypothetical protein [Cyclobacterium marinum]